MRKKTTIILIIIILVQILIRIYFGYQKQYFHMDEMYSYGLMNYNKLNIADNEDFLNKWHNKEYFEDYLEVNDNEIYNIKPVYENQKNDVHPPLYYLLLRISATFTINKFTKWTGILLNITIFIISSIMVYLISKELFKNKIYAVLTTLINGLTLISLNSTLYIRMYELCNLNILIITFLHMKIYNKEKIRPINIFLISTFMILGGLTHYYFFIYAFVLYLIYTVKCIKQKNYKNLMIYNIGIFISSVIYILIFPYAISHIFFSYRGVTVEVDVKKNIVGYCKKINQEFFNGLLPFIIILTGIIAIKPKKSDIKMNGEMVLLVTPILIYLLTIVLKAPYIETRYIIPIYSSMIIAIAYCLREFVRKRASCKHTLFIISIIFFTIIYSPFVKNTKIEYIYSQYNNIAEKNLPIIYVFNTKENRILDDLYLFTLVDKSIIIDVENYDKIEKTESNFILICNNGVNEEKIKSTINGKIEYVQRMNACNIYEVKMDV
ncbi:MAG: hypothetical protein Q4C39_03655 [Clostridia bacterium]|nr:hypothetical protein [Clostridia bacterium]